MLKVLDLFSGIGGFSLGLERTGGFETVAFCEIEPFPRKVLAKHWPEVPCYEDVRTLTAARLAADGIAVDVITGGFPCQDLSVAGKRAGLDGKRSGLWSEIVRLTRDLRPRYLIVENVANLLRGPSEKRGGWFGRVLGDMAELGYDAEWENIPAAAVGAPHRRERVWIMAHPTEKYRRKIGPHDWTCLGRKISNDTGPILVNQVRWPSPPRMDRVDDGFSRKLDRYAGVGNAVIPQIPEMIGRAILASENMQTEEGRNVPNPARPRPFQNRQG